MASNLSKNKKIFEDNNLSVTVRVDKKVKDLMIEQPASRWDVGYWLPKYDEIIKQIKKFDNVYLDEHRDEIKSGYRSGKVIFEQEGYPYLQVRNILNTGVDLINADLIPENSPARKENMKVSYGDILLNRSGEGSVGRLTVFLEKKEEVYVGGHVFRFSIKNISPIYVNLFLKTKYGKEQIHRFESGVSGKTEIDLKEVLHILIPVIPEIVDTLESEYKSVHSLHNQAMKYKKEGKADKSKSILLEAEKKLEEIVHIFESRIEK